jgi:tetratricopeptide (TPR) repeat protein
MHNRATERNTKKDGEGSSWVRAKTIRGKNLTGSRDNVNNLEIEKRIDEKNWQEARALLQEELVFTPTDHWLWMTLSLTYYEEKQYEKALACSRRAVELKPNCPLALWHYAGSLFMSGQESSALAIWTVLRNMDLEDIAYGDCSEGMDWAMQLVNDVNFRIGRYFQWKQEPELARASFQKYLHNREYGVSSIYDKQKAEKFLAQLSR